ncbi:MAG: hypothetical protein LAN71_00625 [Acidobacteriia bacterium]|nr:hypothetical protein [Terriglobia bacterium]
MSRNRSSGARGKALALAALLLLAQAASAYEAPLDSHTVRDAYFLGQRNDEKTALFLAQYEQVLPLPEKGPHVAEIELHTPYAQIVAVSRDHTVGYSSQQAAADYRKRGDTIRVRILLRLTPTYPLEIAPKLEITVHEIPGATARSEDFWKDFGYELRQDDLPVQPLSIRGEAVYAGENHASHMIGAQVWLEYAAEDVASQMTEFEVATPDGQRVIVKFDLEKLR